MKHFTHRRPARVLICLVMLVSACTTTVGDACDLDSDCGTGLLCDGSLPGGYCTRPDCDIEGCPDTGLCVTFDLDAAYCMKPCEEALDCRPDYQCVTEYGSHPFCAVP
jgi:hypothetical protein